MNGETTQHLFQVKHSASEEALSEDDDVPLAQRTQKPAGNEGPDRKKIKLQSSHHDGSPTKPVKLNANINLSPSKPHINSAVKQNLNKSPVKKSPSDKILHPSGIIKKEAISPEKQAHNASHQPASDDGDDDDVPLASRVQPKPSVVKVKPEHKSSTPKPAKSALNSTIEEKNKHEKVKNGKPLKVDKKMDKKSADVKKHDSMKKEKKAEGAKPVKKPVYSDDDNEPLSTRVNKTPTNKKQVKQLVSGSSGPKANAAASRKRKKSVNYESDSDDEDDKPLAKSAKKSTPKPVKKADKSGSAKKKVKEEKNAKEEKGKKKKEDEKEVWKWWEEEQLPEGVKWLHMEHKGPYFPPQYEPLPANVKFYYDGEHIKLSLQAEEVKTPWY